LRAGGIAAGCGGINGLLIELFVALKPPGMLGVMLGYYFSCGIGGLLYLELYAAKSGCI